MENLKIYDMCVFKILYYTTLGRLSPIEHLEKYHLEIKVNYYK